jgi:hypothetical protein
VAAHAQRTTGAATGEPARGPWSVGVLLLAVTLVSCTPTLEVAGESTAPPEAEADEEVGGDAPPPEPEGPEAPDPGGGGGPVLELPQLPIGGAGVPEGDHQCAVVNWSGPPDLVAGVTMEVTEVSFEPPGVYVLSDDDCSAYGPPCRPGWLGQEPCTVPVRWTGVPSSEDGKMFFTAAAVRCPPTADDVCAGFGRELAATDRRGVDLLPPPDDATDGGGDGGAVDGGGGDGGAVDGGDGADGAGVDADADGDADGAEVDGAAEATDGEAG